MLGKQAEDRKGGGGWSGGVRQRNHHVDVVIYQKARSPHKPKCHCLNPALIRPTPSVEDRRLRGLTISVVCNNMARPVVASVTG